MSRTAFVVTFKERVGLSPMDYLTRWRIIQAADRLTSTRQSLAEIGLALGYESEKSFGTAFKRAMNCSPSEYGRRQGEKRISALRTASGRGRHSLRPLQVKCRISSPQFAALFGGRTGRWNAFGSRNELLQCMAPAPVRHGGCTVNALVLAIRCRKLLLLIQRCSNDWIFDRLKIHLSCSGSS
ncbi:hypothetical protein DQ393_12355 [Rhizobium tropici]|uniref:HTH araC/xylS-type domain-containing protein n=1 Tax=Rhizobium tropici TaxID=398 RepID=A0A329YCU1_RHITR|nr:hypothetical protein DQ393_12355 [Rhizobium tropici]